jgi:hypothetical protein
MKFKHEDLHIYSKTFFSITYTISFSHNYYAGKSAVQANISPSLFICCFKWEHKLDFWMILWQHKHNVNWA